MIQDYKKVREKKIKKHRNTTISEGPDNTVYGVNESVMNNINNKIINIYDD